MRRGAKLGLGLFALVAGAAGCSVSVAGALDDAQANRIVVALERAGVLGEKEIDPASEGHLRVVVAREEASHAIAALEQEELPPPASPGVLDALGKGAIVPSPLAEHAQYVAGLSGELEKTLEGIDGVLAARVHISLPEKDPLADGPLAKATASVMLKYRGATPPVTIAEVARLVAGAAPGLAPADVTVVTVGRATPVLAEGHELARVGPIAVARGSLGMLRASLAVAITLGLALVAAVLALWGQVRRLQAAAANVRAEEPGR